MLALLAWVISRGLAVRTVAGALLLGLVGAMLANSIGEGVRDDVRPLAVVVGVGSGAIAGAIIGGVWDIVDAIRREMSRVAAALDRGPRPPDGGWPPTQP